MSDAWRMSAEDAEEYTRALGQIMSGGWRQIALAQRLGVPEAIGMTTEAWVRERIGGYVRLGLDERRDAVKELTDPAGEYQLTQRQAAEVLGVAQKTVSRDLRDESDDSSDASSLGEPDDESESYDSPQGFAGPSVEPALADIDGETAPLEALPTSEREAVVLQAIDDVQHILDEPETERALYALSRVKFWLYLDAAAVAETAADPAQDAPGYAELAAWVGAVADAMQARARGLRAVR